MWTGTPQDAPTEFAICRHGSFQPQTPPMTTTMTFCQESLLAALSERETINVREALAAAMDRVPTQNEVASARRAARQIAEESKAVLMTAYPGQTEGTERRKWGRHAVLYLTTDERVITDLPYRVELATGRWEAVVEEGKKLTNKKIDSDPILSWMLRGPAGAPRPASLG